MQQGLGYSLLYITHNPSLSLFHTHHGQLARFHLLRQALESTLHRCHTLLHRLRRGLTLCATDKSGSDTSHTYTQPHGRTAELVSGIAAVLSLAWHCSSHLAQRGHHRLGQFRLLSLQRGGAVCSRRKQERFPFEFFSIMAHAITCQDRLRTDKHITNIEWKTLKEKRVGFVFSLCTC